MPHGTSGTGPARRGAPDEVLGRERELALLDRFLAGSDRDVAAFVLRGEPGIGKTTLWKAGRRMALERGRNVLSCRPAEAEAKLPFAALGDLLHDVPEESLDRLPGPQRHALDVALLRSEAEGPPPDQRAVSVAVLGLIGLLVDERQLVIAVDDAQWLDRPSHRVLEFAARRLSDVGAAFLLGVRGGPDDMLPLGLERAISPHRLTTIELEPLPIRTISALLRTRLAMAFPHPTLRRLMRISKGNPFFALELGRALLRRGISSLSDPLPVPENLRQLVAARLGRLPEAEREVLLMLSALSNPTIAVVSSVIGDDAPDLLIMASDRGIIDVEGDRVEFAHPLLASTIYADASPRERRGIHARLAKVVRDRVERARHLALATVGPDEDAAAAVEEAAQVALARAAPEIAAELAEQAVRLTDLERTEYMSRRQVEAADYHYYAGDRDRARALITEVMTAAGPGPTRARAAHTLAIIQIDDEGLGEGIRSLHDAAEETHGDTWLAAAIQTELATVLFQAGQVRAAEHHARLGVDLARDTPDDALVAYARTIAAWTRFVLGQGRELAPGEEVPADEGPRIAGAPYPTHAPRSRYLMDAVMLKWSDDFSGARIRLEELRRRERERNDDASLTSILFQLGELECWTGNWSVADRYAQECRDAAFRAGARSQELFLMLESSLAALRGRLVEARRAAERVLESSEARTDVPFGIRSVALLGFGELSAGDPAAARPHYERALSMTLSGGYGEPGLFRFQADAVETMVSVGAIGDADDLVERLDAKGRELDRPWALAAAARGRGLLAAARRDLRGAERALERAIGHHERLEMPFERARTLLVLGGVKRRLTQKRAAREVLGQTLEIFERLDASVWAERTRAELRRIGGRPPAPTALTSTEKEVARLAGEGMTNREIAESLFVSAKTVERHLAHVFAKLGVRSRRELVRRRSGPEGSGTGERST